MFSFRIMKNELKTEALKPNKPKHVCLRPLKKIFKFVIYIKMDNSIYVPQMEFATSKVQHLLNVSQHDFSFRHKEHKDRKRKRKKDRDKD